MSIVRLRKVPVIHFHWVRGIIEEYEYPLDVTHYSDEGDNYVELKIATPDTELGMELIKAINDSHEKRQALENLYKGNADEE